ncbi:DUF397 domain-containing protein [Kitasatospora sp. NPDC058046]|uniref:DUF397 domain-containing protein n=1 Tax=Kitasatospora sp. NPDC058046 TaxID=3346312 RepID=UPI0036DB0CCA
MQDFTNGMPAGLIKGVAWTKARASYGNGDCIELASLATGETAIRNSRDPEGAVLIVTRSELRAFFAGVREDEFDHLVA